MRRRGGTADEGEGEGEREETGDRDIMHEAAPPVLGDLLASALSPVEVYDRLSHAASSRRTMHVTPRSMSSHSSLAKQQAPTNHPWATQGYDHA